MSGYIRDESTIIVNGLPSSVDTAQLVRLFTALTKNEYPTISANVVPDSKRIGFRTGFLNFSKPASAAMARDAVVAALLSLDDPHYANVDCSRICLRLKNERGPPNRPKEFAAGLSDPAHEALCCPITGMLFSDPVVAADGYTYERNAVLLHFTHIGLVSPVTKMELPSANLIPNNCLQKMVDVERQRLVAVEQLLKFARNLSC